MARTRVSSLLRYATFGSCRPSISSALASAISSTDLKNSRCTGLTLVTTPSFGSAIDASLRISPLADIPISSTPKFWYRSTRSRHNGSPNSLFRLPTERKTVNFFPKTAAVISFVVVLPALPVMPMIVIPQRRRTSRARFCKAVSVEVTRIMGPPAFLEASPCRARASLPEPSRVPPTALLISSSDKFMEQFACYHAIIEWMRRGADSLIRLMTFAGDHDGVAFLRLEQCRADRFAPIHNYLMTAAGYSFFD